MKLLHTSEHLHLKIPFNVLIMQSLHTHSHFPLIVVLFV
jgi:hypothetical protein